MQTEFVTMEVQDMQNIFALGGICLGMVVGVVVTLMVMEMCKKKG